MGNDSSPELGFEIQIRAPNWPKMEHDARTCTLFFLRTSLHPLLLAMQLHEIDSLACLPRVRNARPFSVTNSSCGASQHFTASSEKDLPIVTTNIALALATFRRPDKLSYQSHSILHQLRTLQCCPNCGLTMFIIQIASKGRYQVLPFCINRIMRNQMLERNRDTKSAPSKIQNIQKTLVSAPMCFQSTYSDNFSTT